VTAEADDASKDPTHGKPKEFFALQPGNPMAPPDQFMNPLMVSFDQMSFVYVHYPEYA